MIESRGKTLDEAIQSGLDQLGISREDADITVLDEASKGFLGFGAKPARVLITEKLMRVSREEDRKRQAREQRENEERARIQKEQRDREAAEKAEQQRKAKEAEQAQKIEREKQQAAERTAQAAQRATEKAAEKASEKAVEKPAAPRQVQVATPVDVKRGADSQPPRQRQERVNQERKQPVAAKAAEPRPQRPARSHPPRDIKKEAPAKPGEETDLSREAKAFLEELLRQMGVDDVEITAVEGSNGISMSAAGASAGALIGYRGETLDALQYLVSLKINKGEEDYHRISLDSEGYRAKREDILIKLAHRLANKAVKTGRKVSLEPMNPYERRILHSALQSHAAVRTHSEGTDPYRRVVITPKSAQRKPPVAAAKPRVQARAAAENTEQS